MAMQWIFTFVEQSPTSKHNFKSDQIIGWNQCFFDRQQTKTFQSFSILYVKQERDAFLPLAENGSTLFFVISDLAKVNNMYQFSLGAFLRTFQRSLELPDVSITKDKQVIFTQRCSLKKKPSKFAVSSENNCTKCSARQY